jgi:hypothetical protein
MKYPVCCVLAGGAMLTPFEQFNSRSTHMNKEIVAVRVAQALLAVGVTTASVVVIQLAMLAG